MTFRDSSVAQAGGYVLVVATVLVAIGLVFHPVPAGGFEERASMLANTPWWGPIHIAIAAGFVGCVLGSLLLLVAGGDLTRPWPTAFAWGAMTVGMVFFTCVALINGGVMHYLSARGAPASEPLLYDGFNHLLVGYGWLGNPLFLAGLTVIAALEVRMRTTRMPRAIAWIGLVVVLLAWGRGIGSATGMFFLEPLISRTFPRFSGSAITGCASRKPRVRNSQLSRSASQG